jgi:hypothetical protein
MQAYHLHRRALHGALVRLERSAVKVARCVLRGERSREAPDLPGGLQMEIDAASGTHMNKQALLAKYAEAMWSAQALESRLRGLLGIHKVLFGLSNKPLPLTDEELEALLLAANKKTLGQAVHELLQHLSKLGLAFPNIGEDLLLQTVRIRNFLTHHFFAANHIIFEDVQARTLLGAQLAWFTELFDRWLPITDKWTKVIPSFVHRSASQYHVKIHSTPTTKSSR